MSILQVILYAGTLVGLMVISKELYRFFRVVSLPPILSTSLICVSLIYLSALLPGIFGILTASNTYICLLVLLVSMHFCIKTFFKFQKFQSYPAAQTLIQPSFTKNDWIMIALGIILSAPLLSYLKGLPFGLFDPRPILGWDVVSYHLPGVIEFYQNKTLWSLSGPYQSYSFGYELLGSYFSQSFFASWGLIFAHLFALFFIMSAMMSTSKSLQVDFSIEKNHWFSQAILAIGLWSAIAHQSISAIGKNDIFMGASILSSLAFTLILCRDQLVTNVRTYLLILLIGLGLGLSMGVKPSAIAYLPFFWVTLVWILTHQKRTLGKALSLSSIAIIIAIGIGGFWLTRNLLIFGRLSPVLDSGWQSSVIANLLNKDLYRALIHHPILLLASMAWIPAFLLANDQKKYGQTSHVWWVIGGFHLTACLVFAITPFAFQGGGFELRLGMPLLLSAAMIYSVVIQYILYRFTFFRPPQWSNYALVLTVMFAIPLYWSFNKQGNLFGYEQVFPAPQPQRLAKTNIYTWVQGQQEPMRIYSAGLRPYGLYGRNWGNTLFYDLHSSTLVSGPDGKKRIAAIVDQFGPDLILVSLAPHSNSPFGVKPEVIAWMQSRKDLFSEVYLDELVDGFRVNPDAKKILANEFPEAYTLKMGE